MSEDRLDIFDTSSSIPDSPTIKPRGRPKGAKTKDAPVVEVVPTRCPACGSTQRGSYFGTPRHLKIKGINDGVEYVSITYRRCKCTKCGQLRMEKTYNTK